MATPIPCEGCIVQAPEPDAGALPLLVALHGDSHDAREMVAAWSAVTKDAILFAPTCPKDLHCPGGSWWRWYQSADHDPAWLTTQIAAVRAKYPVDPARIYATGYSGGSSYLGYYVPQHSADFAAVAYVSGGYPYSETCASCKLPVRVVIGAADGMLDPYVKPLLRFYETCGGHDVTQRIVPNLGHQGMLKALPLTEAPLLWTWFTSHTAQCQPVNVPDSPSDAGPAPVPVDVSVPVPDSASATLPPSRGCTCHASASPFSSDSALLVALTVLTCVRALRPRTRQRQAHTRAPRHPL